MTSRDRNRRYCEKELRRNTKKQKSGWNHWQKVKYIECGPRESHEMSKINIFNNPKVKMKEI